MNAHDGQGVNRNEPQFGAIYRNKSSMWDESGTQWNRPYQERGWSYS